MTKSAEDFPAPWDVYPEIPCNSTRWRMGAGEDVMNDWWQAMRSLTHHQRLAYRQHHAAPSEWLTWLDWVLEYLQKEER